MSVDCGLFFLVKKTEEELCLRKNLLLRDTCGSGMLQLTYCSEHSAVNTLQGGIVQLRAAIACCKE